MLSICAYKRHLLFSIRALNIVVLLDNFSYYKDPLQPLTVTWVSPGGKRKRNWMYLYDLKQISLPNLTYFWYEILDVIYKYLNVYSPLILWNASDEKHIVTV